MKAIAQSEPFEEEADSTHDEFPFKYKESLNAVRWLMGKDLEQEEKKQWIMPKPTPTDAKCIAIMRKVFRLPRSEKEEILKQLGVSIRELANSMKRGFAPQYLWPQILALELADKPKPTSPEIAETIENEDDLLISHIKKMRGKKLLAGELGITPSKFSKLLKNKDIPQKYIPKIRKYLKIHYGL